MLAPVRAMTSGRATPLTSVLLVTTSTLSGRSGRRVPSAIACDGARFSINAPSASTPATLTRSAVPRAITQAELSFTRVPSGDREIRLVSGPPSLVSLVSSISSGGGVLPRMLGIAPAPAKFELDLHRHLERDRLASQLRYQLRQLRRCHRAVQRVMHLQQRDDALAPAGPHPQFRVARRRALDQSVHCLVGLGASDPATVPGMIGIGDAALRFFARARPHALGPSDLGYFPSVPMPTRPIVELEVALLGRGVLAPRGKLPDERKLAVVAVIDRLRLAFRLGDHRRKLSHTS